MKYLYNQNRKEIKIIRVPIPLSKPLLNKSKTPNPPRIEVSRHRLLVEISRSFISIKRDTSMELKNKATTNDDPKTTDKVMGK